MRRMIGVVKAMYYYPRSVTAQKSNDPMTEMKVCEKDKGKIPKESRIYW